MQIFPFSEILIFMINYNNTSCRIIWSVITLDINKWDSRSAITCMITDLIIHMKKLLDSDWRKRLVQFQLFEKVTRAN